MSAESDAPSGGAVGSPCAPMPALRPKEARFARCGRPIAKFALLCGTGALWAAQASAQADTGPDEGATIVVIGQRAWLDDLPPERSLDESEVEAYGVDTVEDLLGEIGAELGDDEQPVIIVNGERVESLDDIAGYPTEAVRELQVLPRGSGAPVGGSPRQRVYSIVLRDRVRSLAVNAAWRVATEGDWTGRRGEATLTRIKGPDRFNLALRARDEDDLLESERGIVQPSLDVPYDLIGNVIPDPRGGFAEIDPALSALVGSPVSLAAVPDTIAPALAAFAANANRANVTDLGRFRTLRSSYEAYDLNLSMNNRLTPWLRSSLTARANWSDNGSLLGLPGATFIAPAASASSPFSRDVGIAAYGGEPLRQGFRSFTGAANGTLTATVNSWQLSLIGNFSHGDRRTVTDRQDFAQLVQPIVLDPARNPFAGDLGELLVIVPDRSLSRLDNGGAQVRAIGSPVTLPAGRLRLTSSAAYNFSRVTARSLSPAGSPVRRYRRNEAMLLTSIEIPLASRRNAFLSEIGELSANLEFGVVDFSDVGTFTRHSWAVAWSPQTWLRILASTSSAPKPADVRLIADPVVISPGSRYFDFLTGETVDVADISGGNPLLRPERRQADRLTVTASPMNSINLQLNAEYSRTRTRGFISGVPPASAAIQLAFPDRFMRDATGRLVSVDTRPVNFERQRQEQLRYGLSFSFPIGPATPPSAAAEGDDESSFDAGSEDADAPAPGPSGPSGPRPRLQFSASHAILFDNEVLIRPGIAPVDLLAGGAIGVSGSPPRHQVNANLTASGRGLGASLTASWRSESRVQVLTAAAPGGTAVPDTLRFAPIFTAGLRAYANLGPLVPELPWLKGSRITLSVNNIGNQRQRVRDGAGLTPLRYQPGYRDPIGRIFEIEFRKVF